MTDDRSNSTVELASNLTVAWLSNPNTRATADDATGFLKNIHGTLASFSGGPGIDDAATATGGSAGEMKAEPAVTVRKSLASRNHIISLIDGKPYVTLKRHLSGHGLTPAQYRERFGLKPDYPMVAPAYAEKRRAIAKQIGLGSKGRNARKAGQAAAPKAAANSAAPKRRGRPPKAASA
jgi:predicted transcriptional regulator